MENPNSENKDSIEDLKKRLYSRVATLTRGRRRLANTDDSGIPTDWSDSGNDQSANLAALSERQARRRPALKRLLLISIAFFALAAGYATYSILGGKENISGDNVKIAIAGPVSVGAGEVLPLDIAITNSNAVPLQAVNLTAEYPSGTKRAGAVTEDLLRYDESLGTINPGQSVHRQFSAVLFGEEKSTQTIKVSMEYRVPDTNAVLLKEKTYDIVLSSAPVSLSIESLKEANAGQPLELSVTVKSNSSSMIQNLLLKAEYGFGFSFVSSDPAPLFSPDTWRIGDLKPGASRTIKIKGTIDGQNEEERAIRFAVGVSSASDDRQLATTFLTTIQSIIIKKPFVGLSLAVNGDSGATTYSIDSGSHARADINWSNNTTAQINNLELKAVFSGNALDQNSVVTQGYYRSMDDSITWNSTDNSSFASIGGGVSGMVSFNFSPTEAASLISAGISNPTISLSVSAAGNRVTDNGIVPFTTSVNKLVKISSRLNLSSKMTYYDGPFVNTGPIPPRTDTETTYTVTLDVANGFNSVSGATVSARLPPYVRFVGTVSPQNEQVTFNPVGGTVTWNVGRVPAFAGFSASPRTVSFQIVFLPSISTVGQEPVLVDQISISGTDDFTGDRLTDSSGTLTSNLHDDSMGKQGDGTVRAK